MGPPMPHAPVFLLGAYYSNVYYRLVWWQRWLVYGVFVLWCCCCCYCCCLVGLVWVRVRRCRNLLCVKLKTTHCTSKRLTDTRMERACTRQETARCATDTHCRPIKLELKWSGGPIKKPEKKCFYHGWLLRWLGSSVRFEHDDVVQLKQYGAVEESTAGTGSGWCAWWRLAILDGFGLRGDDGFWEQSEILSLVNLKCGVKDKEDVPWLRNLSG